MKRENLCMNGISPASILSYFAHVEACVDKLAGIGVEARFDSFPPL